VRGMEAREDIIDLTSDSQSGGPDQGLFFVT
jgi:hypothetical protein